MMAIATLLLLVISANASPSNPSCTQRCHLQRKRGGHFPTAVPLAYISYHHHNRQKHIIHRKSSVQAAADRIEGSCDIVESLSSTEQRLPAKIPSSISTQIIPSPSITSQHYSTEVSRRTALLRILSLSIISSTATSLPDFASASEIDTTGELFTSKNVMIKGGGSAAARGIPLNPGESRKRKKQSLLQSTGLIQNVYETRFITYLARFLLVFDPAASAWWEKNSKPNAANNGNVSIEKFAEFAESVEVGLADYFLGPYGSYASVAAAKAGIAAAEPAKSVRGTKTNVPLWSMIFPNQRDIQRRKSSSIAKRKSRNAENEATNLARQGILNLLSLLKARYTSIEEKQQLAILFSFISQPELQPVQEIRALLGEVDNGTIAAIEVVDLPSEDDEAATARDYFRLSSRQGGGFSKDDDQIVRVEPPAPLGAEYKPAVIRAVMKPTTRILRINVIDGGKGYTVAPDVVVKQRGVSRQCEACAVIDRNGSVSEIIVLNPGFGYGGTQVRQGVEPTLPTVEIRERKLRRKTSQRKEEVKPAKAVPELEYKVVGVDIISGGSGYLFDQPPKVTLDLPTVDPDWFGKPAILSQDTDEDEENQLLLASVTQMKSGTNGVIIDTRAVRSGKDDLTLSDDTLRSIQNDPIALLPSNVRPVYSKFKDNAPDVIENGYYSIMSLPPVQSQTMLPSSTYRSIDLIFGGIGKAPVTINALTLSPSEYLRLALSGAICTVLVRTALNPLELVKTKIQLGNDEEILNLAMKKASEQTDVQPSSTSKPAISTTQVIESLVEVRGPLSLFQSADITFITSIVFGLFGFGATELFRRSFSAVFFDEAAAGPNEFLFLAAAGLATLLTCAAGAPFEILRVRSMSTTENQGVKKVFGDFVEQNRVKRSGGSAMPVASTSSSTSGILSAGLQLEDIKPLWSSFNPIVSRELPFAVTKFFVFDLAAGNIATFVNGLHLLGDDEIKVGVGTYGLLLSAFAGALAGIAGAFVSHPADLILTLTSASTQEGGQAKDWRVIVKELLAADGGVLNLLAGFPARAVFFFLVIGAQFFLYDYIKTLLDVGTEDLTLVLDVFYAIRQGLL